jgi:hypothetical protein
MSSALESHGTLLARAPTATPTTFTTIAELKGITPPPLGRNTFDVTPQQDNIDAFVPGGVLRRNGNLVFGLNWLPTDASHDHLTGILFSMRNKNKDGFRVTYPDASTWILSGYVTNYAPAIANVEGPLLAQIEIRPSGPMSINGTAIL